MTGLKEGQRRQADGARVVVQNDPLYHEAAMSAIAFLAARPEDFTADDLQAWLADRGVTPRHPNSVGAAVRAAVHAGVMRRVGYKPSERPKARARVVAVYLGTSYAP